MYHHRHQPPPHLANKNTTAFASNNYSNNSSSNQTNNITSTTAGVTSSTTATVSSNNIVPTSSSSSSTFSLSTSTPLSSVANHNNINSNTNVSSGNANIFGHSSPYHSGIPKQFIEERQDVIFRRVRGILNKITPETFDKLTKELVNVGLDSPRTLRGVIYLLFDKALKDLKYSSLYAKLCQELSEKAPNFEQEPGPNTFCKFLISKCEDEFERRRKATEDFDDKNELTDEEYELKAIAKQKMLGNIKFICELGKKRLLQEEILHECIRGLLSKKKERPLQDQAQDLECLCQIMRTIGSLLDIRASRNLMNQYFDRIDMFSKKPDLPSRIRFMLRDVIDLRNNNWRPRPFQREDNVPQPLSKLREEAGFDGTQVVSSIDKVGNKNLLGMGDLSKLHGSKLSSLLIDDDEPSFTTTTDFHWGSTFLPHESAFDAFSASTTTGLSSSTTTTTTTPVVKSTAVQQHQQANIQPIQSHPYKENQNQMTMQSSASKPARAIIPNTNNSALNQTNTQQRVEPFSNSFKTRFNPARPNQNNDIVVTNPQHNVGSIQDPRNYDGPPRFGPPDHYSKGPPSNSALRDDQSGARHGDRDQFGFYNRGNQSQPQVGNHSMKGQTMNRDHGDFDNRARFMDSPRPVGNPRAEMIAGQRQVHHHANRNFGSDMPPPPGAPMFNAHHHQMPPPPAPGQLVPHQNQRFNARSSQNNDVSEHIADRRGHPRSMNDHASSPPHQFDNHRNTPRFSRGPNYRMAGGRGGFERRDMGFKKMDLTPESESNPDWRAASKTITPATNKVDNPAQAPIMNSGVNNTAQLAHTAEPIDSTVGQVGDVQKDSDLSPTMAKAQDAAQQKIMPNDAAPVSDDNKISRDSRRPPTREPFGPSTGPSREITEFRRSPPMAGNGHPPPGHQQRGDQTNQPMPGRFLENSNQHQFNQPMKRNNYNPAPFPRQQGPRRMHNNENVRPPTDQVNNNNNNNYRIQKDPRPGSPVERDVDYHRRNASGPRDDRPVGKFFNQDGPPPGFHHQNHHQDHRGARATHQGQAMGRNQSFESQPDISRSPNWRKNHGSNNNNNNINNPMMTTSSSSSANPPKDPSAPSGVINSAISSPMLPKPPTRVNATNFSLRPSHNLIGRTLSGPNAQQQQPQNSPINNAANLPQAPNQADIMAPRQKESSDSKSKDLKQQTDSVCTEKHQEQRTGLKRDDTGASVANNDTSGATDASRDLHVNKFIAALSEYSNDPVPAIMAKMTSKIKDLKIPKNYQSDCLVSAMKKSILKSESDRENTSKLVTQLVPTVFDVSSLLRAFEIIFEQLHGLEVETPRVKSMVAGFLSKSVQQGPLALEDVGNVLLGGKYHPLFLLVLQQLEKSAGQVWLTEKFAASKIQLMDMLPEADRTKERLASSLKDRCLGFLDPMLTIEPDLWLQMSERDPSPAPVYRWIKENVDQSIQSNPMFAHVLISCLMRYIHNTVQEKLKSSEQQQQQQQQKPETDDTDGYSKSSPTNSSSQSTIDIEKELLTRYEQVLQALLTGKQMQLATLYALQSFYHGLDFPKGALLRWFHMLYDLNIVDDDVFFIWKEEINDQFPGKGQALFQVNTWLNWLAEAESEEEDDV